MKDGKPPDIEDRVKISEEAHRLYDLREEARRRGYTHVNRFIEPEPDYDLEYEMSQYRSNRKKDVYIFAAALAIGGGMIAVLLLGAVLSLMTS